MTDCDRSKPVVMVVDDDHVTVSLLRTLLQMDGFEVQTARPGEPVADRALTLHPDVILLDVFLSGADGLEQLVRLRSQTELAQTAVVMCSGMDVGDRCLDRGADAFLLKPYSPDQLMDTIRACLQRRRHAAGIDEPQGIAPE